MSVLIIITIFGLVEKDVRDTGDIQMISRSLYGRMIREVFGLEVVELGGVITQSWGIPIDLNKGN
jgi:hypothetical protein